MELINHLRKNFNDIDKLNNTFIGTNPYPMIVLDNFLPTSLALDLHNECETIPDQYWTNFTRNGSNMFECKELEHAPIAYKFVNEMHSALGLDWLSKLTGIKDLVPDPYLVGAGYSRAYKGDSLKIHTDFNWNDKIKLHRMLSFIVYLNPDWKEEYGGALEFTDFNRKNTVQKIPTMFNRAVIWRYHKRGFHGFPEPIMCPEDISRNTFRLFYYYSDTQYKEDDRPHRSLYWYDEELQEPYDIPTKR